MIDEINQIDNSCNIQTDMYCEQHKYIEGMRSAVSSFEKKDPAAIKKAINNITLLRVYHQISRIIRYTEMMDRLEDKLYQAIDMSLDSTDETDPSVIFKLAALQEKLQSTMIESQKLLDPYLNNSMFESLSIDSSDTPESFATVLLEKDSRQKVRENAAAVLAALEQIGDTEQ